ncbi:MAG TPA: hypothetical protein VG755_34985 [Nannocystaceae bacterium]|nr:hypothetical protein [Nannocystaceae bacterium]
MRRSMVVLFVAACGPSVDAHAIDESTGAATSTGDTSTSTTAVDVDTSAGALDCEASTPSCADGCTLVSAHFAAWDDIHVGATEHICVAEGPPIAEHRSTWWAMIDGELRIITSTPECLLDHPPTQIPIAWTECTGSGDEPAACGYLCAEDVCPGEVDVDTIRGCTVPEPCGDISLPSACDEGNLGCFFAALRDRTPGRYELAINGNNNQDAAVLLVSPDGSVRATVIHEYDLFCAAQLWQPARTCSLADPQLFDDCVTSCAKDCYPEPTALTPWLVDCVDEPAVC